MMSQSDLSKMHYDGSAPTIATRQLPRSGFVQSALCSAPHNAEIGAAWPKRSNEGRNYLSVKLDDPSGPPNFAESKGTRSCALVTALG